MDTPRIVFEEDEAPRRKRLVIVAVVVLALLVAGAYGLYRLARSSAGGDWSQILEEQSKLATERETLEETVARLNRENSDLRGQVAFLEQSQEIDGMACEQVSASLAALQDELAEAQKQIAFYRGIVSPEEARAGVRIRELALRPTGNSGVFSYRLMLIQARDHARAAKGRVSATVVGLLDGAPARLDWATIRVTAPDATPAEENLSFDFRYFQELAGELALPANFEPLRVELVVTRTGRRSSPVKQSFEWQALLPVPEQCDPVDQAGQAGQAGQADRAPVESDDGPA